MDTRPSPTPLETWESMTEIELAARLYAQTAARIAPRIFFNSLRDRWSLAGEPEVVDGRAELGSLSFP